MKMMYRSMIKALAVASAAAVAWASAALASSEVIAVIEADGAQGVRAQGVVSAQAASIAAQTADASGADGWRVLEGLSSLPGGRVFAVFTSEQLTEDELAAKLAQDPSVSVSTPGRKVYALDRMPNDPEFARQWGHAKIGLPAAWDASTGASDVYVAIVDSGIQRDPMHPDLAANVADEYGAAFIAGKKRSDFGDVYGHGTQVAGIIGAVGNNGVGIAGASWRVGIIPIRILDSSGSGNMDDQIYALDYVASLMAKEGIKVAAINLSLGGYTSETPSMVKDTPLWKAFKQFDSVANGPLIVVAAGNEGSEVGAPLPNDVRDTSGKLVGSRGDYMYPASLPDIDCLVAVAAFDDAGGAPAFTNWSSAHAHIAAPGSHVTVTDRGSGYTTKSGTSYATPYVSGVAALVAAAHPGASREAVKRRILLTADKSLDPYVSSGASPQAAADRRLSAFGLLRADRAVKSSDAQIDAAEESVPLTGVKLSARSSSGTSAATVHEGGSLMLSCAPEPSNAVVDVAWSSSNTSVATVDKTGCIKGVSPGTAMITATASKRVSGVTQTATDSIQVTVTQYTPPPVGPSGSGGGSGGCAAFGAAALLSLAISGIMRSASRKEG